MGVTIRERVNAQGERILWADLFYKKKRKKPDLPGCILTGVQSQDKIIRARATLIGAELYTAFIGEVDTQGESYTARKRTLLDVVDAYMNRSATIAKNTRVNYKQTRQDIQAYIDFLPENKKNQKYLDSFNWQEFEIWLINTRKLGHSTVWINFRRMVALYNFAVKKEWITKKPKTLTSEIRRDEPEHHPLSPEQVKTLIDSDFCKKYPEVRSFIILGVHLGLRIGDMCRLCGSMVKEGAIRITTTKTKKTLSFPINKTVQTEIDNLRAKVKDDATPFFPGGAARITYKLSRLAQETGIPVHAHGLRHTCAVMMLRAGIDIYSVSRYLGHESVQTTEQTYAKFVPERQKAASDALERMFDSHK